MLLNCSFVFPFEISVILSSLVFTSILTCLCVQKVFPCKIVLRVHALPIHGHYSLHRYYGRIRLPATLRIVLLCSSFDFSYHLSVEVQGLPSSCQFLVYTCHGLRPRGATLHSPYRIKLYCLRHIRKASTNPKRLRFEAQSLHLRYSLCTPAILQPVMLLPTWP